MPPKKDDRKGGEEVLTRIAIVSEDKYVGKLAQSTARLLLCQRGIQFAWLLVWHRCKPKKCRQECKKSCPVVKVGKFH